MSRIEHIKAHPTYRQLSVERLRLGLSLSAMMAGTYFAYILTVAFWPQALGTPLAQDTVMTWGLLAGVGIIALGFLLTALYVVRANSRFDALSERLAEDVR
ncbi:MAG TPA: DUF485 domain-containing protein [Rhodopila sp.]|nr:DUF485 domain-containing protein [Rhodopila sp.]